MKKLSDCIVLIADDTEMNKHTLLGHGSLERAAKKLGDNSFLKCAM